MRALAWICCVVCTAFARSILKFSILQKLPYEKLPLNGNLWCHCLPCSPFGRQPVYASPNGRRARHGVKVNRLIAVLCKMRIACGRRRPVICFVSYPHATTINSPACQIFRHHHTNELAQLTLFRWRAREILLAHTITVNLPSFPLRLANHQVTTAEIANNHKSELPE